MIWNPLDPLGSWSAAAQSAVAAIIELFQQFIGIPVSLDGNEFVDYLYGNALGVYDYLALLVVAVTLVFALFFKRGRASFAQAVVVVLVVAILGPLWFAGFDEMEALGYQLSVAANLNKEVAVTEGLSVITLGFPAIKVVDTVLGLFTYLPLLYFMHTLFNIFVSYAFWTVAVKFLGLISLSLLALGDRARKVFSALVAIGVVTIIIGRPVAILFISIGQGLSTITAAFSEGFIQGMILNGAVIAAILIQPVLVFLMYKGVSPIVGKVAAAVTGRVKALSENRVGQSARALSSANVASLQGRSQAIPYNKDASYGRRVAEVGAAMAIAKGAAMLAAKAGSAVPHPAVKVISVAGLVALKAVPKKRTRP